MDGQAALWAAVLASGVYHGLNPGMGWPLAVAAGLTERRGAAVVRTLAPLAAGHLVSLVVVLLPFAALTLVLDWSREIRIAAGLGHYRLRGGAAALPAPPALAGAHPPGSGRAVVVCGRAPARGRADACANAAGPVRPASALASVRLSPPRRQCRSGGRGRGGAHGCARIAASGLVAGAVYRALGLGILRRSWFDLRRIWAGSLALVGALACLERHMRAVAEQRPRGTRRHRSFSLAG